MKNIGILFIIIIFSLPAFAQLEVKEDSFNEVPGFVNIDMDKQTDDNDQPYAVLKIRTENINAKQRRELDFKGDARTFFETEYRDGEVWLYISYYASFLKISHPDLSSTEFWFPYDMKPKCGYELTLVNKTLDGEDILNRLERLENANLNVNETSIIIDNSKEEIIKRGDYYYYNKQRLTKSEYKELLKDCPEAWSMYKKGKKWSVFGYTSLCVGLIGGYICYESINDKVYYLIAGAGISVALATPAFIISSKNKKNAYKEYNKNCAKHTTLSMGITSNGGVGLTLNF